MTAEVEQPISDETKVQKRKTFELLNVLVEKVTGTVKWFSAHRHYGFIQRNDNNEDVFVHSSAISVPRAHYPVLKSGETVEFSVVETTGGVNAASVTGPNGQVVKGVYMFPRRYRPYSGGEGPINQANGDVEGTRYRGGPRRYRQGKRPSRPSQNGMGDSEAVGMGEPGERNNDGAIGMQGNAAPRGGPWRFRGGGRGRGRHRSTSTKQQPNGELNGEDCAPANAEDAPRQQHPRRGGRFRRGGGRGRRGGGNRAPREDGETAVENTTVSLENQLENMSLDANSQSLEIPKETGLPAQQEGTESVVVDTSNGISKATLPQES